MSSLLLVALMLAGSSKDAARPDATPTEYQVLKVKYDGCMKINQAESICKVEKEALEAREQFLERAYGTKFCNPELVAFFEAKRAIGRPRKVNGVIEYDDPIASSKRAVEADKAYRACVDKHLAQQGYFDLKDPEEVRRSKWTQALASGRFERQLKPDR